VCGPGSSSRTSTPRRAARAKRRRSFHDGTKYAVASPDALLGAGDALQQRAFDRGVCAGTR